MAVTILFLTCGIWVSQNTGQDNNSPAENVHNMTSGTLGQWIGKEKKYMHVLTENTYSKYGTRQQLTG